MRELPANLDPLVNHSPGYAPLVTVALMTHEEDVCFLPRSMASLMAQDFPPEQMEVVITFDGQPSATADSYIVDACIGAKFPVRVFWNEEKSGYYTMPRNRTFPAMRGLYVVHMDADNEFKPEHLKVLVEAMRIPDADQGWPHFAYTRRQYVRDAGASEVLPEGPSPFIPWTPPAVNSLMQSPKFNFVDTGDFIVGRGVLYELAERTGYVWNPDLRRFGDWELVSRLAACGFRGKALDVITHTYHWTGKNVSSKNLSDFVVIPAEVYEALKAEGKVVTP